MDPVNKLKTFNNDIILRLIVERRFRILRHLCLIVLLGAGFYNSNVEFSEPVNTYLKIWLFSVLLFLFYINMYRLVPRLLFKDNYLGYFFWLIALFFLVQIAAFSTRHFVSTYLKAPLEEHRSEPNLFAFYFIFIILMGASAAVKLFQRWVVDSQRISELETITIQSELENLKKQINPHFLFNTLNNANVLTQKDPEKASQVLVKLSDLLRYQLYDSARNKVFLTSDIHFLEDFLNLEKIRRDNFDFSITLNGELQGVEVAPLLFITFVENAVKHNIDAENSSYVYLFFSVIDDELNFHCINSKPHIRVAKSKNGGLGLTNVMRRLELLYPGRHELKVTDTLETFNVHLTIKI